MNKKIVYLVAAIIATSPLAVLADDVSTITTNTSGTSVQQIPSGNVSQVKPGWRQQNKELRTENQQERAEIASEKTNLKQQAQENRCQNIQTRISTQVNRYQNNQKMFITVFGNMKARLTRLSQRLASKGIDVTKLNADIATLDTKITKLSTDYDAFITSLKETNSQAATECGNSQGQFMNKLLGARKVSLTVEQDRLDVRNFFQSTIRPDIMSIRKQLEDQKTTTKKSTSTDSTTPAASTEEAAQ